MQPNKPVVLVVDDDPVNLDILVQTLEQDYFLIIAKNGKRALDLAFSHHPDLILLDILMPEMDGFEVCQRLKADKETEGIPVIFLSVMESPGQKHRGFEVGGVDYVTKPFHADEVLARVRTHITNKRLREELESHNMLIGMELHEKSRQLETLMNNLPGLAYQGEHSPDRKVRFVSQGVTRLTGYTPEHFMGPDGMGLLALVHPDDRAHVSETLENALRKKEPFELTYRIITSWNEEKWVWEQGAGVHAGGAGEQAPLLVEGFINDVTEKQKQDNTIRQENKELRERLKARCSGDIVGQFAADHRPSSISSPKRRPWTTTWSFTANRGQARNWRPGPSTTAAPGISSPLWRSTAGPSRKASLKASCSATRRVRSPVRRPTRKGIWIRPTGARFSSTNWVKSASWGR